MEKNRTETCIRLDGVTKSFQDKQVLDSLSMQFEAGCVHGVVGYNGCGKTVLLKCICGLMRPDSGTVRIVQGGEEREANEMPTFGVVIETAGFIDRYDGYANLKALADIRKKLTRTEIEQVMQKLGLDPRDRKKVKHYSLGMRQRLAIAQAIMEDPPVLLLDEPLNGLDYEGVKTVYQIIKEQRSRGKVILVASHHEEDIRLLCDKVLWLNQATLSPIEDINAYTMYDVKGRELA